MARGLFWWPYQLFEKIEAVNRMNLHDDEILALYDRLLLFTGDPTKDVMIFPENLNGRQRRILRLIANKLSLYHCNEGEGSLCRLMIKKTLLPAHFQKAPTIGPLSFSDDMVYHHLRVR